MARTCQCGQVITCGCKDRVANDGTVVCSSCVANYNAQLAQKKNGQKNAGLDYNAMQIPASMAPQNVSVSVKFNNFNQ